MRFRVLSFERPAPRWRADSRATHVESLPEMQVAPCFELQNARNGNRRGTPTADEQGRPAFARRSLWQRPTEASR
jgi:hypothetical protein